MTCSKYRPTIGPATEDPHGLSVLAGASLSGLPPSAGFFSKEAILECSGRSEQSRLAHGRLFGRFSDHLLYLSTHLDHPLLRKKWEEAVPNEGRPTASRYWAMAGPIIILAVIIRVLGFFEAPLKGFLLGRASGADPRDWVTYGSLGLVVFALALAWFEFGRRIPSRSVLWSEFPPLRNFLAERWYLDHFYRIFLDVVIYRTFANLFTRNDRQVLDGGIDAFCQFTKGSGRVVSYLQSGSLRSNLLVSFTVLGLVAL